MICAKNWSIRSLPAKGDPERLGTLNSIVLPFCTFLIICRPQDIIPMLGVIRPGYIVTIILLIVVFVSSKKNSNFSLRHYPEIKWILGFMALMYLSPIFAEYRLLSVEFLIEFITVTLYVVCLCKHCHSLADIRRHIWIVNIGVLIMSVFAFSRFNILERVSVGTMYDPNDTALIMVTNLPLAYYLTISEKKWKKKALLLLIIVLSLITIISTKSRGGFLGLIACVLCILWFKQKINEKRINARKIILTGIIILVFLTFGTSGYWDRINTTFSGSDRGSGRTGLWSRGLEMISENPVLGVGVKNFTSSYGIRISQDRFINKPSPDEWASRSWLTAHNSFLQVSVELGIPGFLFFAGMLVACSLSCINLRRYAFRDGNEPVYLVACILATSLISFIVCAFFLSFAYNPYLYYLLSLVVILRSSFDPQLTRAAGPIS